MTRYVFYPIAVVRNLLWLGKPDIVAVGVVRETLESIVESSRFGRRFENREVYLVNCGLSVRTSKQDVMGVIYDCFIKPVLCGSGVRASRLKVGRRRGGLGVRIVFRRERTVRFDDLAASVQLALAALVAALEHG